MLRVVFMMATMITGLVTGLAVLVSVSGCQEPAAPVETVCGLHGCVATDGDYGDEGKADGLNVSLEWGTGIKVVGEPKAARDVIADLEAMRLTGVGAAVLAQVEQRAVALSDRVFIRARPAPTGDPTGCANTIFVNGGPDLQRAQAKEFVEDADRVTIKKFGESIKPSLMRVLYNRECHVTDVDGTSCDAPMVFLMHELIHTSHAMHGEITSQIRDNTDPMPGGSNHEEARTIGRGAYLGDPDTENALRMELDLPLRNSHGSLCGVRR